jgi:tetratricopeptide (TPR) repeat protein
LKSSRQQIQESGKMKKALSAIAACSFLMLLFLGTGWGQSVEEVVKKADDMHGKCKSATDYDPLIKLLKDTDYNNPDKYELVWRAARALCEKADVLYVKYLSDNYSNREIEDMGDILDSDDDLESPQEKTLLDLGTEARSYAGKAVKLNPNGVEGHFYTALGISMYSLGKSILSALLEGLSGKLEDALDAAIKLNKMFDYGASLRIYGRYYFVLPWPKRDLDKSEEYLQQAVQVAPNSLRAHIFFGDTLWKLGKKQEAKVEWQKAGQISDFVGMERIHLPNLKIAAKIRVDKCGI